MSKLSIKIVEIHQPTRSVVVKFVSENSRKSIDEYDGLAFNLANFPETSPEKFIELILPQISRMVSARDRGEVLAETVDLSGWQGFSTTVDSVDIIDPVPAGQNQLPPSQQSDEVVL